MEAINGIKYLTLTSRIRTQPKDAIARTTIVKVSKELRISTTIPRKITPRL